MKAFYDFTSKKYITEALIKLRGLPLDDRVLQEVGIYKVELHYTDYDIFTQQMLPDGEPVKLPDGTGYVQNFTVHVCSDEVLSYRLRDLAQQRSKEVLNATDAAVNQYMSMFSDVERATWPTQQKEVHAYLDDPFAPTPTLDGLAAARGIDRELMLQKATAKVQAFEPLSVAVVGRQQMYEDRIAEIVADDSKSLVDRINELRALEFDFSDILLAVSGA